MMVWLVEAKPLRPHTIHTPHIYLFGHRPTLLLTHTLPPNLFSPGPLTPHTHHRQPTESLTHLSHIGPHFPHTRPHTSPPSLLSSHTPVPHTLVTHSHHPPIPSPSHLLSPFSSPLSKSPSHPVPLILSYCRSQLLVRAPRSDAGPTYGG
jgi:hypothetical protein